jgi:SOUL heme-binding protein
MKIRNLPAISIAVAASLGLAACASSRAGYETATYSTTQTEGAFEIRQYPELTVATTVEVSDTDGAFMRLFRYIQGANEASQKIAMTTPVFMEEREKGREMAFVLPQEVSRNAPAAKAADVKVGRRPAASYAVLRFSGGRSAKSEAASLERLRGLMKEKGMKESGPAVFAYYDPPWTPGPMRRNEVMLKVAE